MILLLFVVSAFLTIGWILLHIGHSKWGKAWRLTKDADPLESRGSVRVIIPARNEESAIGACLSGLAKSELVSSMEVYVVDDGSEDNTGPVAAEHADSFSHFQLLTGSAKPDGWAVKRGPVDKVQRARRRIGFVFWMPTCG